MKEKAMSPPIPSEPVTSNDAASRQHGVWGGLVAAERAQMRARLPAYRTGGRGTAVVRDDGAAVVSRAPWRLVKDRDAR
jgi:hypothetical protein